MGSMRRRLDRLEGSLPENHDPAIDEAMKGLTDIELELLNDALERGFDPQRSDDVPLSPEEQRAYERFLVLHAEARARRGEAHLH